jgi:hypothetical protein
MADVQAENVQLKGQVAYLSGLVAGLKAQRDQNADQAADAAARYAVQAQAARRP